MKIIFFDFDNTLFSHYSHSVPDSVYKALELLKQNNIKTCLCTGRGKFEIDNYFDLPNLKFDYYIYFNGQQVLDGQGNTVLKKTCEGIVKENAIKMFNEKKIPIVIATKDDYYINFVNEQVHYTCESVSSPVPKIHEYQEDDIYMFSIFPGEIDNLDELVKTNFPGCIKSKWTDGTYDIIMDTSSKAEGIENLIKVLNIDIKDTYAFGDADNDVPMMQIVNTSIAMGNASEEVKQKSTYTTTHIDDDGIYNGLKHFNLI